jgi:hypothetical protein
MNGRNFWDWSSFEKHPPVQPLKGSEQENDRKNDFMINLLLISEPEKIYWKEISINAETGSE